MTQPSDVILHRMMSLHPKIIDLKLDRMWRLLAALNHPERALPPVIHFAGTNGKGSTLAMIRAGLEAAGKSTHAYTSPHLARFHERIRIAGTLISEPALTAILDECVQANGTTPITYFEITTAAALLAFSRTPADFTLLEVGLGGRLDATNVTDRPALTIITPVSIDHQQYLGDALAQIATEKAGILKPNTPCIVAAQPEPVLEVIEARAARLAAPLLACGQHWHVTEERNRLIYQDEAGLADLPLPNLIGAHQIQNAGTAIAALRYLNHTESDIEAAITTAQWPGRLQRLKRGPLIEAAPNAELWLDGGHNAAAGAALAEALTRLPNRPTHLICGMLKTKDATGFLAPLAHVARSLTAVTIPGETATLSERETRDAAKKSGHPADTAKSVHQAILAITTHTPSARILICGSLYLAGHILRDHS